ncbi:myosuppressin [Linepithema humile]|uniref:myosuppressin n=1 Tax=Linepithema humile TaxID=83485 RepID=UPI0006234D47|nr:PREDICTED: myosuppressin isoform X2 [Linepithema humile]
MMSSTLVILVSVTTVAILSGEASAALPTQCNTGFLEELPPRLRKLCFAIARLWDARDVNDFVDDSEYRENLPRYASGVKRQDVDHVFLRFGKRR